MCSLLVFHGGFAGLHEAVLVIDHFLEVSIVELSAIVQLHTLWGVLGIGALELPHATVQHSWYLLDFGLGQLSVLVLVAPDSPIATIL